MSTATILTAAEAAHKAILTNEADIEALDRAIGDGDHYHNLKRGAETVAGMAEDLSAMEADAALKAIGMKLMSTIGGASGPLISSFILAMAKTDGAADPWTTPTVAAMFRAGVDAIMKRGKANLGDKTMLDVLIPVADALEKGVADGTDQAALRERIKAVAQEGMESTRDLTARYGRAAFLGERAVGHIDPGAKSSSLIIASICDATA